MKRLTKRIVTAIVAGVIGAASAYCSKEYNLSFNLGLTIIIATVIFEVLAIIIDTQNEKIEVKGEEIVKLEDKNACLKREVSKLKRDIEKLKSSYTVSPGEDKMGNNLLFMALTQDPAEPLKITMLEKAANDYRNIIAALILGNIYWHGIEKGGKILLEGDKEKAFQVYESISRYDNYGVSDWIIGWYYQNNYIDDSKKYSDEDRYKKAREYYTISKDKGFPKAKNSLGNFIINDRAGFDSVVDSGEMFTLYREASKEGDNYATLNYGHYFLREYQSKHDIRALEAAKEQYSNASKMKSPEGYVKLVMVNIEFHKETNDIKYLEESKKDLIDLFSCGANQFVATGYCILGTLLKQHPKFFEEIVTKLPSNKFKNPIIECYVIAYEIFLDLITNKKPISEENKRYYEALSEAFQNANIDFLKYPPGY